MAWAQVRLVAPGATGAEEQQICPKRAVPIAAGRSVMVDCHDGGYFYCPDICKVIVPIMLSLLTIPIHYDTLKKRTNTDFLYSH